jgi:hypothetical protein
MVFANLAERIAFNHATNYIARVDFTSKRSANLDFREHSQIPFVARKQLPKDSAVSTFGMLNLFCKLHQWTALHFHVENARGAQRTSFVGRIGIVGFSSRIITFF